ncbi:MAG: cysteine desulfurase [Treponema sp.]|nr:cysteine desulfurase [Treponema sp.]
MNIYRKDFPLFKAIDEKKAGDNNGLIYFDSAATSQRPYQVLEAMEKFYREENANPLRGLYKLSERATQAYEDARKTAADFLNAGDPSQIIFTRNATESLNLIAYSYGLNYLKEGDQVLVSIMEHHSNIVPWQQVCKKTGAQLVFLDCDKNGLISDQELDSKLSDKVKIFSITQVSNVLGVTNPVKEYARKAHAVGAIFIVDGAQSVPHHKVDVRDIDADFFALSGHKLCGPMGIGVLYGKKELLEKMPPFLTGGEMIEYVTKENATWAEVPHKFEAGTVSAADAVGLSAAMKYLQTVGFDFIEKQEKMLTQRLMQGMKKIPHVNFLGSDDPDKRSGIVTFTIDGVHPHDIATLLSDENIAIRAGHHCAQPLGKFMGVISSARASLYFYNTEEEVDLFLEKLSHIREWSGYKD